MPLTITIAAYFVIAAILWVGGERLRRAATVLALIPYAAQLVVIGAFASTDGDPSSESIRWIPSLGVEIGLRLDTMTVILTAIVAGIGALIVIYSDRYLTDHGQRARFLALLAVFTGGMAGIVASNELFGLFLRSGCAFLALHICIQIGFK